MKSERWRQVSPHLDRVLDLAIEERQPYLNDLAADDPALAADLELLLGEEQALRAEGYLEHDAQDLLAESPLVGQVFGAYALVEPLGTGGMGSVWLARRTDGRFEGNAAVKLLSPALLGAEGAARFRREGTILARLKHPHIAQLIDAGVSAAGQPYLVLEYVEGEPIDRWCDHRALDVPSRVRLFLDVTAAVAYAHSHLVVHRDLKPSNVMVSKDGQVKLLDFGIAKLLQGDTEGAPTPVTLEAGRAFTPAFAAPEQVLGERVTTATDVYSLGALLYFLLVGRHPAGGPGASPAELLRAILETDPDRLSEAARRPRAAPAETLALAAAAAQRATTPERLRRDLRGDLEIIVAKALKKRPEERYASVTAMAEDLRRYLVEEPILACPDSLVYRAGKFMRRNARGLAAAAAAVLVLVAVVAFYGTQLADERDRERLAAQKAAQVSEFLTNLLTQADPFEAAEQGEPTVRSLLDRGAARVRKDFAAQPELRREMLNLLGRIYERRGAYERALPLLDEAVALGRQTLGPGPSRELAQSLHDLGVAQGQRADWDTARATLEAALTMRRQVLGAAHPDTAVTESELGRVLFDHGSLDKAEAHFRAALAIRRKTLGSTDHETAASMNDLGLLLRDKGDRAGAEALFRENLAVTRKSRGPKHPDVAAALGNLALTVNERDHAAAEAMLREAMAIGQASLGRDHPANAQRLANLAGTLRLEGKLAEAEATCEEALAISRQALGPDHPAVSRQEVGLASVYLDQDRPAAAKALLLHALAVQQQSYAPSDWRLGITESLLGATSMALSRFAEAEPHLLRAFDLLPLKPGFEGREARESRANRSRLVALYEAWGRPEKAAPYRAVR